MPQILPLGFVTFVYVYMNQNNISIKFCGMHAADSTIRLVTFVYIYMKL